MLGSIIPLSAAVPLDLVLPQLKMQQEDFDFPILSAVLARKNLASELRPQTLDTASALHDGLFHLLELRLAAQHVHG